MVLAGVGLLGGLGDVVIHAGSAPVKESKKASMKGKAALVTVADVTQKTVPVQLQAIGSVLPGSTVAITPEASGRITGVYFKKGQDIKKGQLLFTLDSQTQAAAIQQAQGTLAKDQAAIESAKAVVRGDTVAIQNAGDVVKGDLAAIQNAQAVADGDRGAMKNVQVQQSYTKIYSPIDGRAGNILVMPGNVVQANGTNPLVSIAKTHPIQVGFSIPEGQLADVKKYMQNGKLNVNVVFADGKNPPISGVLSFVNNTVDNTTGTIQLIGDFENTNGQLFPGQYVKTIPRWITNFKKSSPAYSNRSYKSSGQTC